MSNVTDTDSLAGTTTPQVATKSLAFSYDLGGNLHQILPTGGPATTHAYDKADRRTSITHDVATDIVHAYGYDTAGRITSFNTGPTLRSYGYDDAGQLTSKSGGAAESYNYDDNGNRRIGTHKKSGRQPASSTIIQSSAGRTIKCGRVTKQTDGRPTTDLSIMSDDLVDAFSSTDSAASLSRGARFRSSKPRRHPSPLYQ